MEQNTSTMAKKMWNILRVAFFLLKKGLCKRKILMDLTLVMKRGKIAGKALQNLITYQHQHQQHQGLDTGISTVGQSSPPGEYEFSCSNTPEYLHYFSSNKKKNHNKNYYMPSPSNIDHHEMNNIEAINNMFSMMMLSGNAGEVTSLPALPAGYNPAVRQLRITDSPFPVQNSEDGNNNNKHVDDAAEDFINKFYSQLKNQNN